MRPKIYDIYYISLPHIQIKGHNYSDPQKKYFCTGISLGVVLGLISHVVMFFSKNSAKKVSGQKLEKWPIFGLSKLIRN